MGLMASQFSVKRSISCNVRQGPSMIDKDQVFATNSLQRNKTPGGQEENILDSGRTSCLTGLLWMHVCNSNTHTLVRRAIGSAHVSLTAASIQPWYCSVRGFAGSLSKHGFCLRLSSCKCCCQHCDHATHDATQKRSERHREKSSEGGRGKSLNS